MRENSYFPCGVSEPGLNLGFLPLGAFAELLANVLLDSFNVFPHLVLEILCASGLFLVAQSQKQEVEGACGFSRQVEVWSWT